jgi:hypothetical protein
MITNTAPGTPHTETRVRVAAEQLYAAECALHTARESRVDAWITAAADRLHQSVVEHLAAVAALSRP